MTKEKRSIDLSKMTDDAIVSYLKERGVVLRTMIVVCDPGSQGEQNVMDAAKAVLGGGLDRIKKIVKALRKELAQLQAER